MAVMYSQNGVIIKPQANPLEDILLLMYGNLVYGKCLFGKLNQQGITNQAQSVFSNNQINAMTSNGTAIGYMPATYINPQENDITIEFYFRFYGSSGTAYLPRYKSSSGSSSISSTEFGFNAGWNSLYFKINSNTIITISNLTLNNNMHHIAATWDHTNEMAKVYVDGQLLGNATGSINNTLSFFYYYTYSSSADYSLLQLCIWDGIKYTSDFTPSADPIYFPS